MATATLGTTLTTPLTPRSELPSATKGRILVIEDDDALRKIVRRLLSSEGYEVDVVPDPSTCLEMIREKPPLALVLSTAHPESSGIDLCRKIAALIPGLPLVILSERSDVEGKVLLLEMGADDYLTVPFSPRELVARLRAIIRRGSRVSPRNLYRFGKVMVDFFKTEITRGGEKVTVTAKEFKTLEFLIKNAERVISRSELLNEVWGYRNYPCTRTVDNHIMRLRQKLENDPSHPSHLVTIHAGGYKFVPEPSRRILAVGADSVPDPAHHDLRNNTKECSQLEGFHRPAFSGRRHASA
jgi:DNA-binding response OmpR family regulator